MQNSFDLKINLNVLAIQAISLERLFSTGVNFQKISTKFA